MKCAACGYEKRSKTYEIEKVTRFKSGKRKGEVKSVESDMIEPDGHKDNFIEVLPLGTDQNFIRMDRNIYGYEGKIAHIYACPSCGTLKIKL